MVGYGTPRVGNLAFADYVDSLDTMDSAGKVAVTVTRINNKKDPVPILPGRFLGFTHPSGEVHIQDNSSSTWVACPGQDNPSKLCSVGAVPTLIGGRASDHVGPYDDGIYMGSC